MAGSADTADELQLKVAFLHKFSLFTEWPNPPVDEFRFCLLGQDSFENALKSLENKRVGLAVGKVALLAAAKEAKGCHALFLRPSSRAELVKWLDDIGQLPVLTVSDRRDCFEEGVIIALQTEPNRIGFKINLSAARSHGLSLSAMLLKLATEVR